MDRLQAKEEIKRRYAEYLHPAKVKGTYVCPLCGNGTGRDGDGLTIWKGSTNPYTLKCFKCGASGDVIDFYQQEFSCDFNTAFTALCEQMGIVIEKGQTANKYISIHPSSEEKKQDKSVDKNKAVDFTEYYNICQKILKQNEQALAYLQERGISYETACAYGIGFDPIADPANAPGMIEAGYRAHPCPRLIIPFDSAHYMGRSILPDTEKKYQKMNNRNGEDDSTPPFNLQALYNPAGRPVFITEGSFDALSIIEAGGLAIAINSAGNRLKIMDALKERKTTITLILCLDDDEAGQRGSEALEKDLKAIGVPYVLADICGQYKDANEALVADRSAFVKAVTLTEKNTKCPGIFTKTKASSLLKDNHSTYIELPSFPNLARQLKLKVHDTVIIAGDTGVGKSSFSLNILHDMQKQYQTMYFDLEMSEVMVVQRLVAIHTGMDLDQIERYDQDEEIREKVDCALEEIESLREFQLLENMYDIRQIETYIRQSVEGRTEPTVVFIDTGLLVKFPGKSTSRYERFTQVSEELRRISRMYNIIMFIVLQQNREGKKEDQKTPTNASLKESGSWENDATKIMFLWNNPATNKKELVVTKNRGGALCNATLDYIPSQQRYQEAKDIMAHTKLRKPTKTI